jgi:hypothetical protein
MTTVKWSSLTSPPLGVTSDELTTSRRPEISLTVAGAGRSSMRPETGHPLSRTHIAAGFRKAPRTSCAAKELI